MLHTHFITLLQRHAVHCIFCWHFLLFIDNGGVVGGMKICIGLHWLSYFWDTFLTFILLHSWCTKFVWICLCKCDQNYYLLHVSIKLWLCVMFVQNRVFFCNLLWAYLVISGKNEIWNFCYASVYCFVNCFAVCVIFPVWRFVQVC